ncbi:MAG: adenylate/guanylate cyclase domain-containing protein, partial [Chthoniobacterales bacterium]
MPEHADEQIDLEVAHVLYLDIVSYSKLPSKEQPTAVDALNEVVRASEQFQKAEAADRLLKIPTGDGMALIFYSSPEAPARCAVEVARALKQHPRLPVRMGVHSGSVTGVVDVNSRANLAGAGLNIAQRVMDCGDAGHILVSKNSADDLREYERWLPLLHSLGTCEVKHGVKLQLVNLYDGAIGNPRVPARIRAQRRRLAKKWIGLGAAALVLAAFALSFSLFPRR